MAVRFVLNGKPAHADEVDPHLNLLTWLRREGFTGSKEGCAEGECGACAVALVEPAPDAGGAASELNDDGDVSRLIPVNSCLLPLCSLEGRHVITVEGVAAADGSLHPVQRAMVESGGSQCGYCTPGFIMSMFCEFHRQDRKGFEAACVSGNLCRCTGYRPIRDAMQSLAQTPPTRLPVLQQARAPLRGFSETGPLGSFLRPESLEDALHLLARHSDARVLSGGTDLMVEVNQRDLRASTWLALEAITELYRISTTATHLVIGAATPLAELERWLRRDPVLPLALSWLPWFASPLIRERASLGGSLVTASPIGDAAPLLLALDAELDVARLNAGNVEYARYLVRDFFVDYRKCILKPGELLVRIAIPKASPSEFSRFYKVSKRALDDISTVAGAFCLERDDAQRVRRLRMAYAGIAATPLLAVDAEQAALGRPFDIGTRKQVVQALAALGTPIDDRRGSAAYRKAMTQRLFERFCADYDAAYGTSTP